MTGSDGYKVSKYMFKDVYMGIVKFLEPTVEEAVKGKNNPLYIPEYFKNADGKSYYSLLASIIRGSLGMSAESGSMLQKFVDFWSIADQARRVFKLCKVWLLSQYLETLNTKLWTAIQTSTGEAPRFECLFQFERFERFYRV